MSAVETVVGQGGEVVERLLPDGRTLRFENYGVGEWLTKAGQPAKTSRRAYLLDGVEMPSVSSIVGSVASCTIFRRPRTASRLAQHDRIVSAYARACASLTVDALACNLSSASIPVADVPLPIFAACDATCTGSCSTGSTAWWRLCVASGAGCWRA